ncbi:hypothetical protein, partial [Ralstonia pseudosolanacearum]|uniref:hypothetical protein n=1 Tax=Ralstonia pseudosolanacearum TaxID=1310165 RepID=UPI003221AAF4
KMLRAYEKGRQLGNQDSEWVRLANRERAQLLLESASRAALQRLLATWTDGFGDIGRTVKGVRWQLEIDPLRI